MLLCSSKEHTVYIELACHCTESGHFIDEWCVRNALASKGIGGDWKDHVLFFFFLFFFFFFFCCCFFCLFFFSKSYLIMHVRLRFTYDFGYGKCVAEAYFSILVSSLSFSSFLAQCWNAMVFSITAPNPLLAIALLMHNSSIKCLVSVQRQTNAIQFVCMRACVRAWHRRFRTDMCF